MLDDQLEIVVDERLQRIANIGGVFAVHVESVETIGQYRFEIAIFERVKDGVKVAPRHERRTHQYRIVQIVFQVVTIQSFDAVFDLGLQAVVLDLVARFEVAIHDAERLLQFGRGKSAYAFIVICRETIVGAAVSFHRVDDLFEAARAAVFLQRRRKKLQLIAPRQDSIVFDVQIWPIKALSGMFQISLC